MQQSHRSLVPCLLLPTVVPWIVLGACSNGGGGGASPPTVVFEAPARHPVGAQNSRELTFVDVDRDGRQDALVVSVASGGVVVLRGLGNGALAAATQFAGVLANDQLAVGDLDADSRPDAVVASSIGTDAAMLRNLGDGTFAAPVPFSLPTPVIDVQLGDVTGDGHSDLIAASSTSPSVFVLPGNGTGGFGAPVAIALAFQPGEIAVADLNGDGRLDLLTNSGFGGQVVAVLASGAGGFDAPITTTTDPLSGRLALCDLDGDRRPDVLLLDFQGTRVLPMRGDGTGRFVAQTPLSLPGAATLLAAGDLDFDGRVDCLVTIGTSIHVCYGGAAGFGPAALLRTENGTLGGLQARDVGGDGPLDLGYVVGGNTIGMLRNSKALPQGLVQYGIGSPDCGGTMSMLGTRPPQVGTTGFAFVCTNAPKDSLGVLLLGGPADVAGTDLTGLGFLVHLGTGLVVTRVVFSDVTGTLVVAEAMPTQPSLAGLDVFTQVLWQPPVGAGCAASPAGISSSRGLQLTIQP